MSDLPVNIQNISFPLHVQLKNNKKTIIYPKCFKMFCQLSFKFSTLLFFYKFKNVLKTVFLTVVVFYALNIKPFFLPMAILPSTLFFFFNKLLQIQILTNLN